MAIQTFTSGQVLTTAQMGIVAKGSDLPSCSVKRTAALNPGSNVAVTFDTEEWDNDTMFAPSSDTITIKTAGIYLVHVWTSTAGTAGTVAPNFVINGAEWYAQDFTGGFRGNIVITHKFAANDTLKFRVYNSGGTYTATGTIMRVQYLGINA